ncbi:12608_t:CDS:1, partial [Cetraspora pellucida]
KLKWYSCKAKFIAIMNRRGFCKAPANAYPPPTQSFRKKRLKDVKKMPLQVLSTIKIKFGRPKN